MKSNSWVIIHNETGEAVLETFSYDVVRRINTEKYHAMTAYDYLCELSRKIKDENDHVNQL